MSRQRRRADPGAPVSALPERFLSAVDVAVFAKDAEFRWIYGNAALARGMGRPLEDILGRTNEDLFVPEQAALFRARDQEILDTGRSLTTEAETVWNGHSAVILSSKALFVDPADGKRYILGFIQEITSLKRALAALHESESLHRAITEIAPVAIVVHEMGRILLANQAAAQAVGLDDPTQLTGRNVLDLLAPEGRAAAEARIRQAMDRGRLLTPQEYLVPGANGEHRTLEGRSGVIPMAGGQALITVFQDVSEFRRQAKALEESERALRTIFNSVHSAVFLHGADGSILDVNDRMLEMFGVTREQALSLSVVPDLTGPGTVPPDIDEIWREVLAGRPRTFDWVSRKPGDGSLFNVEVHLRRVNLPDGVAALATVTDITDRKRALAALLDSEARYRALFENAPDGIALIRGGRFLECNPRLLKLYGSQAKDIRGARAGSFSPEFQPNGRKSADLGTEYVARAEAGEPLHFEWRHRRPDGGEFDAEVSLRRVGPGEPPLLQSIVRDITERKKGLAALQESETRYRTLVDNFPNGAVLLFDRDMRILLAGGLGLSKIGLKPADLTDRFLGQVFTTDLAAQVEELFRQALAGDTAVAEMPLADRVYEMRAAPLAGPDGTISSGLCVGLDISGRKRLEEQLRHQALHDPLTGLANRTLCLDRIRQAIERTKRRPGYTYAVLFVDLDRFKVVNDSMGHKFGDALLVETAGRLQECVRDLDTVARLGGDEFVLILEELESPRRAVQVAHRVRQVLNREYELGQRSMRLSASIGMVLDTRLYRAPEDVLQNANLAMHRAKDMGRDRFKVFTHRMLDAAVQRLNMESGLRRAIAEDRLFLVYQPMIRLGREVSIYGFEALVRWRRSDGSVVGPAEFIPLAEESGIIIDLGLWVLRRACRTYVSWSTRRPEIGRLALSVNLSGRQFAQPDLVGSVRRVLQETGMPPERLKLEITETALMENAGRAVERLLALKDLGIRLSVDDFGTGYSNLIYLQQLPLDHLKIDLSFVQKMDVNKENVEIVKAVISLAHTLGLEVVAEGVERPRHHEILTLLDCEYGQGYLYSPPLPEDEALAFVRDFTLRGPLI
jgi:diguanylate cyclase (GGDEF)-like protein/PAS domain S-box-containing protein